MMSDLLRWVRSAACSGGQCVEVAWSQCTNGGCVQVGRAGAAVLMRDSKDPGPMLSFTPACWALFVDHVRAGHYDRT